MSDERPRINILLLADDSASVDVLSDALRTSNTHCRLMTVPVGREALVRLRREGGYDAAPVPDLILFDAVDPRPTTLRLLQQIRADRSLRSLPIVVLTNDESQQHIENLQTGQSNYTAFSPVDLDSFLAALNAIKSSRFTQAITSLENFGFVLVRMPAPRHVNAPAKTDPRRSSQAPRDVPCGNLNRRLPARKTEPPDQA